METGATAVPLEAVEPDKPIRLKRHGRHTCPTVEPQLPSRRILLPIGMRLELHAVHRLDVAIQRGDRLGGGLDRCAIGVGARLHGVDPLCEGAVGVGAGGLFAL